MIKDIRLSEDYATISSTEITGQKYTIESNENIFVIDDAVFNQLSAALTNIKFDEWGVKACLLIDHNLVIQDRFIRSEKVYPIDINGYFLIQADIGLLREVTKIVQNPPSDEKWNTLITNNSIVPVLNRMTYTGIQI